MHRLCLPLLTVVVVLAWSARPAGMHAQPAPPTPTQVINLGHVEVRAVPDMPPPPPPGPVTGKPSPAGASGVISSREVSLADAQALVDFPILQPAWLPAGLELVQVQELGVGVMANPSVILVYRDPAWDASVAGPREIVITQQRWAGFGPVFIANPLEEGRIGEQVAVFWTRTVPAPQVPTGVVERTFALWEQGEVLLQLNTSGFDRAELIAVAASLTATP